MNVVLPAILIDAVQALLAVPAFGLGYACRDALEVGVGEVVQGDGLTEAQD